jgi:hypothetical protein
MSWTYLFKGHFSWHRKITSIRKLSSQPLPWNVSFMTASVASGLLLVQHIPVMLTAALQYQYVRTDPNGTSHMG